jgi:hypothetical protein
MEITLCYSIKIKTFIIWESYYAIIKTQFTLFCERFRMLCWIQNFPTKNYVSLFLEFSSINVEPSVNKKIQVERSRHFGVGVFVGAE